MNELGLTGVLRPTGEFLACSYGNHGVIAKNIPQEEEMDCIYFSSSSENNGTDNYSIIYFNTEITKDQLTWIINNISKLDKAQYKCWVNYIQKKIKRYNT